MIRVARSQILAPTTLLSVPIIGENEVAKYCTLQKKFGESDEELTKPFVD